MSDNLTSCCYVRVTWPNGKTNRINFGDEVEKAAKYVDQMPSPDGRTRTLVYGYPETGV